MAATPTKDLAFQNFYQATLTADITASATDIFLDVVPNSSEGFLVIEPDSTTAREVIYYNTKTATKVTCPSAADGRGQDDTTAGSHSTGATVIMAPVAAFFEALQSGLSMNAKAIRFNTEQGFMQNGVISRTVSSNNITVAIKTLAGNDPSTSDPVIVRIGDSIRTITSALSVTKNAGTNWFDSGSTTLATNEIDYFVYLGYNATDGVTIGFARIPYARVYGDFNATSTNARYCAISTITNAASTDSYEVVGRFNATLSGTAAFNWSVPATSIIINRPIYETRRLSFTPIWANLTIGNGTPVGNYVISYNKCHFETKTTFGSTTSVGGTFPSATLPFPAASTTPHAGNFLIIHNDNGVANYYGRGFVSGGAVSAVQTAESASGTYTSEIGVSSTVPFTFATADNINNSGLYQIA